MAENELTTELAQLLAKYGATTAATSVAQRTSALGNNIGQVASYIREIITGDQIFDERVLDRVVTTLKKPG